MTTHIHTTLSDEVRNATAAALQSNLYDLIDLALQGKQAHWNVIGSHFRTVHLELDEIVETTRAASDEVAERIATLGVSADGRARSISENSQLTAAPADFQQADTVINQYAQRLTEAVTNLRKSIETLGELDPVSQDLLIGVTASLEKHLWMFQAQLG